MTHCPSHALIGSRSKLLRITIKQIAQELGISHSTVSRVLNDKQSNLVSETTRDRIVEAARRMGYRPSRIARALQGKSTDLIGVFVPDTADYFFDRVIRGLRHTVEDDGYELIIFTSSPSEIAAKWYRLLQWDLDGAFVFDYMFYVDGLSEALVHHAGAVPPLVGLFSGKSQLKDYVTIDFERAVQSLLARMLARGCRRFAYMGPRDSFGPEEQRFSVFSDFVRDSGVACIPLPLPAAPSLMEAARQCTLAHRATHQPMPDALFCQNDEIAIGAYRALRESGLRVPNDVALAGCDDIPYVSYVETPLTSISLPVERICAEAWRILRRRIAEPEAQPMRARLDASLCLRAST
jgi:LacI family transcriptional regulator